MFCRSLINALAVHHGAGHHQSQTRCGSYPADGWSLLPLVMILGTVGLICICGPSLYVANSTTYLEKMLTLKAIHCPMRPVLAIVVVCGGCRVCQHVVYLQTRLSEGRTSDVMVCEGEVNPWTTSLGDLECSHLSADVLDVKETGGRRRGRRGGLVRAGFVFRSIVFLGSVSQRPKPGSDLGELEEHMAGPPRAPYMTVSCSITLTIMASASLLLPLEDSLDPTISTTLISSSGQQRSATTRPALHGSPMRM